MVVEQQLERARLELLDMGLRSNPQLNYRSGSKALDIIDEQSAKIFEMLVEQENTLSFLPLPEAYQQKIADSEDEGSFFQTDNESELPPLDLYLEQKKGAARFTDKYLQTGLVPAKLDKALLKLETEAHTMLQEKKAGTATSFCVFLPLLLVFKLSCFCLCGACDDLSQKTVN
ncbi:DUF4011 domain-containing protein [Shewanella baltica]|uniref:DUF4011 domain-containing protein n=1 Tax=Shewanella baltica TaxID=62322 RepID=UPI003D79189B